MMLTTKHLALPSIKRWLPVIVGILLGCLLAFAAAWLCGTPLPCGSAVRP
jgi:hypothetical protein